MTNHHTQHLISSGNLDSNLSLAWQVLYPLNYSSSPISASFYSYGLIWRVSHGNTNCTFMCMYSGLHIIFLLLFLLPSLYSLHISSLGTLTFPCYWFSLSSFNRGLETIVNTSWYVTFGWYPLKIWSFLKRNGGSMDVYGVRRGRGRGNIIWNIIHERRINKIETCILHRVIV